MWPTIYWSDRLRHHIGTTVVDSRVILIFEGGGTLHMRIHVRRTFIEGTEPKLSIYSAISSFIRSGASLASLGKYLVSLVEYGVG